jgi:integrase
MSLYLRGRVWWSRIIVNGVEHQFSTKARNKNAARAIEAAKRTDIAKGLVGLSAPTLTTFATRFINSLPGRVAKETVLFYVRHFKPLLAFPEMCDCRLDRINPAVVQNFVQWRRQSVSVTTVNHNLRTLRRALHLAEEWEVIRKVPKVKLLPGETQRDFVLTDEAIEKFSTQPILIRKLVPFLVDTGLRRSEVCALTWDAVNLPLHSIEIRKGKTKYSRRRIPLTKRAEQILLEVKAGLHWAPAPDHLVGQQSHVITVPTSPYVFVLRGRDRMTGDWLSHEFLRARRRLKLPNTCVLHSTRHTFCTRLGERGADAFAIQRLAGHSSIVISQRYVHPAAARLDAAIALLE